MARSLLRIKSDFKIKVKTPSRPVSFEARAYDLSTDGIGFLTDIPFNAGQTLDLNFRFQGDFLQTIFKCKVVRQAQSPVKGYSYLIGAIFESLDKTGQSLIQRFITRESGLFQVAKTALYISFFISAFLILKGFFLTMVGSLEGASFADESLSHIPLKSFVKTGLLCFFGAGLIGFLSNLFLDKQNNLTFLSLFIVSLVGCGAHYINVLTRVLYLFDGNFFFWLLSIEIFILLVWTYLIVILISRKLRFDLTNKSIQRQLDFEKNNPPNEEL